MTIVGPQQPMAANVQENLRQMVDHILSFNPECPEQVARRRINTRMRMLQDNRIWGGLLTKGNLIIPASYTAGAVTFTNSDTRVVGNGACAWPVADKVNTTLSADITVTGETVTVTPTTMLSPTGGPGIEFGDFLLIDYGLATQEVLLVQFVTSATFNTKCRFAHTAGAVITQSSFVRRQIRLGVTTGMQSIVAVGTTDLLYMDLPWPHSTSVGSNYQILKAYHQMGPDLKMIWSVVNNTQGWRLRLNLPQEVINMYDTWRATTGWTYAVVDLYPDEVGRMQYELYPAPTSEQGLPYLAFRTCPNLVNDDDTPPPCIPSHVLVNGAIADVLLLNPKSPYYSIPGSQYFGAMYDSGLATAMLADDSVYMNNLQWAWSRYPYTQHGAQYWQSHDSDSVMGYV